MTLGSFSAAARERLEPLYGEAEARSLVGRLAEGLLCVPPYKISTDPQMPVKDSDAQALEIALDQLCEFRPLQYVLGFTEFAGFRFKVREGVLIPRPETEELVRMIVEDFDDNFPRAEEEGVNILDVCTGSGCIAHSLAAYIPEGQVYGCDISEDALKVAFKQKIRSVEEPASKVEYPRPVFFQADVLGDPPAGLPKFDIIVSNPPYVCQSEKAQMSENVLRWEPSLALFVPDDDPLRFYRAIAAWGSSLLCKGGYLYFEINERFGAEVSAMLTIAGYRDVQVLKDINGKDRFVRAKQFV